MKKLLAVLFCISGLGASFSSPYTQQILNDPAFSAWITLHGGNLPGPELFGGTNDAVQTGGVWTGTDNTAAITACLSSNKVCYLKPGSIYGIKGTITIGDNEVLTSSTDNRAILVKLDDINIDHAAAGTVNGLGPQGTIHDDRMITSRGVFTTNIAILSIVFDSNGGTAHRRASNAGALSDDHTYTPGSQPIYLTGNAQRVEDCVFRNLAAQCAVLTQTYYDVVSSSTVTVPRLNIANMNETFSVYICIVPYAPYWIPNYPATLGLSDYVWQVGPKFNNNTFEGPFIAQTGANEFPPRTINGGLQRPEISLITVASYTRFALNGATNSTIYYPYQGYRNVEISGNHFKNLNVWRNSDTDKQIAKIHCITPAGVKNLTVANNDAQNVDGTFLYMDNNYLLGATIHNNTADGGVMRALQLSLAPYPFGMNRSGAGGWIRDVTIANNEFNLSGVARISAIAVDKEQGVAFSTGIYGIEVQSAIGQNGEILPNRWKGLTNNITTKFDVLNTNGWVITTNLSTPTTPILFTGDDFYQGTATEASQEGAYERLIITENKFLSIGEDYLDEQQYIAGVLFMQSLSWQPRFTDCNVIRNMLDGLNWSGDNNAYLPLNTPIIVTPGAMPSTDVAFSGNTALRGDLLRVNTYTRGISQFQIGDPSVGVWGPTISKLLTTNTLAALGNVPVTADTNGMVYLCSNYRGLTNDTFLLYTLNALAYDGATRFIYQSGPTNLVLPYANSGMGTAYRLWYDGSAAVQSTFEFQNVGTNTVVVYAASTNGINVATHDGLISYKGVDTTNGISVIPSASVRLISDIDAHYVVLESSPPASLVMRSVAAGQPMPTINLVTGSPCISNVTYYVYTGTGTNWFKVGP